MWADVLVFIIFLYLSSLHIFLATCAFLLKFSCIFCAFSLSLLHPFKIGEGVICYLVMSALHVTNFLRFSSLETDFMNLDALSRFI